MIDKRVNETTINASLDAFLHGAQEGDAHQVRRLHEMLDMMLTEREGAEGRLWLTDHGKMVLADMHRKFSRCGGAADLLRDTLSGDVELKPHAGHWSDTCSYIRDLRIAITVANELCEQRNAGGQPDVSQAAQAVADRGEFDLQPDAIRDIYDEIAATVVGFREISRC
jgi:hypothetical protein